MEVSDGKRFCLLCRLELTDLSDDINIHPVPCQEEMDNFVPVKITTAFGELFRRLVGSDISHKQYIMFDLVEHNVGDFYSGRLTGKTTFLLVYIIYKGLETGRKYGILCKDKQKERRASDRLKKMLILLTEDEMNRLRMDYTTTDLYRFPLRINSELLDTFHYLEFSSRLYDVRDRLFSGFMVFRNLRPNINTGLWTVISDPLG